MRACVRCGLAFHRDDEDSQNSVAVMKKCLCDECGRKLDIFLLRK